MADGRREGYGHEMLGELEAARQHFTRMREQANLAA
jgi:hypothetical protein